MASGTFHDRDYEELVMGMLYGYPACVSLCGPCLAEGFC